MSEIPIFLPKNFYLSFDEYVDSHVESQPKEKNEKAEVIERTISEARDMLDVDLMPILFKNEEVRKHILPYASNYKHLNLYKLGWRMQFGSSKQWAGLCSIEEHEKVLKGQSKNRNIYISIQFTKYDQNWKDNFKDTMLHEMAHAVIFEIFYYSDPMNQYALIQKDPSHLALKGHGTFWNYVCSVLTGKEGCARYYENAKFEEKFENYKYVCFNCDHEKFGGSSMFASRCERCGKAVIIEKNEF
jgi:hypothetical protein